MTSNSVLRNVFLITGTMLVSLLVYSLIFGNAGKSTIYNALNPIFQSNIDTYTMNGGSILTNQENNVFNSAISMDTQ